MTANLANEFVSPQNRDGSVGQGSKRGTASLRLVGAYFCASVLVLGLGGCPSSEEEPLPIARSISEVEANPNGTNEAPAINPVVAARSVPQEAEPGPPVVTNPNFTVTQFAALPMLDPGLEDPLCEEGQGQQYAMYSMVLSDGTRGFPKGLLATTGPFPGERSDRIFHFDEQGTSKVLVQGFAGSQQMIWTTGKYAQAGALLVAEPISGKIRTVLEGGSQLGVLVDLSPVVASGLTMGPDIFGGSGEEVLYVSDMSNEEGNKGGVWRVPPPGSGEEPSRVSDVPLAKLPDVAQQNNPHLLLKKGERKGNAGMSAADALLFDTTGDIAGKPAILAFTFSVPSICLTTKGHVNLDGVYSISPGPGAPIKPVAKGQGLNGLMFAAYGPDSGGFGKGIYIPMLGTPSGKRDGAVTVLEKQGNTSDFLTNIHATSVVFDKEGVLGVPNAMYVAAFDPYSPGVIWRVVPK